MGLFMRVLGDIFYDNTLANHLVIFGTEINKFFSYPISAPEGPRRYFSEDTYSLL